jgi:hypothetical protein
LLGSDSNSCPAEENVEAVYQFFNTIGKQLDENPKSRRFNDVYFNRLKELTTNTQLAPRLRFMARDVLDLRSNNWVPRREEVNVSAPILKCICISVLCARIYYTLVSCKIKGIKHCKLKIHVPQLIVDHDTSLFQCDMPFSMNQCLLFLCTNWVKFSSIH